MKRSRFKTRNAPLQAKTPMRKRSPKRAAYMASSARTDAVAHMLAVKALPCVACGAAPPSEAHHVTGDKQPRNDLRTIPLCKPCHLRYHARKRTWVSEHGPDYIYLVRVDEMLNGKRPPQ